MPTSKYTLTHFRDELLAALARELAKRNIDASLLPVREGFIGIALLGRDPVRLDASHGYADARQASKGERGKQVARLAHHIVSGLAEQLLLPATTPLQLCLQLKGAASHLGIDVGGPFAAYAMRLNRDGMGIVPADADTLIRLANELTAEWRERISKLPEAPVFAVSMTSASAALACPDLMQILAARSAAKKQLCIVVPISPDEFIVAGLDSEAALPALARQLAIHHLRKTNEVGADNIFPFAALLVTASGGLVSVAES